MYRYIKSSDYSKKELISIWQDLTSKQPSRRNEAWGKGFRFSYESHYALMTLNGEPVLKIVPRYNKWGEKLKTADYEVL